MRPTAGTQDWDALRDRLSGTQGRAYWECLDALLEQEPLRTFLAEQYPSQQARLAQGSSRREFLKLMGASLALAGAGACTRQPEETIVPYARNPEATIPGRPLYYATAMPQAGGALGLLVESHLGRPTKVEGNDRHPASFGSTSAAAQAAVLDLYDPERARVVRQAGQINTWSSFFEALHGEIERLQPQGGKGLALLVPEVLSPSLARQLRKVQEKHPGARVHQWQVAHRDHERRGAELAFGRDVSLRHHLYAADVVLSLDSDFLASGPAAVRSARDFFRRRREGTTTMSRLYALETTPSLTGSVADHRRAGTPAFVERLARGLAVRLGAAGVSALPLAPAEEHLVGVLARDLQRSRGASLVLVGPEQSPAVHALGHLLNALLDAPGHTLSHADPLGFLPGDQAASLRSLVEDMQAGSVQALLILEGNPVYDAPADFDFAKALERVPFRAHLGFQEDETSQLCHWHLPQAHFLESWGDARAFDGTLSVVQPLIAPLYEGRSALEVAAAVAGALGARGHDLVRETWKEEGLLVDEPDFEKAWRRTLHDGLRPGSALPDVEVSVVAPIPLPPAPEETGMQLCLRLDASVGDGRSAGNGWLQELPRPLTLLTWDNAVLLAPGKAAELGLETEDLVELSVDGRRVRGPVFLLPGQPENLVTVHLGHGREAIRGAGAGVGFNAYPLRTAANPWYARVDLEKVGGRRSLATVQDHARMEGRDLVRRTTWEELQRPAETAAEEHEDTSLFPPVESPGYAWGMVIDLGACIGCSACTVACQAENNIPVVGKEEVQKGREMHWIRVDRYFEGESESPQTLHQPVPCMHCENAPCELVCPVGATVHSNEGLNEMVYNRCVGTRYCSNNCPYKVRRFNFFHYADTTTESLKLGRNPDVTVRTRGVMEKCTYCVQRINEARIQADRAGRRIREGEVVTACQAVCPSEAIVFGDLNDPASKVARLKQLPRHYELLGHLGVRPRTTYLARLRNPSPELPEPQ